MDKYDTSQITEFPRYEPESSQSGVSTFFNKLWKFPLFSPSEAVDNMANKAIGDGKDAPHSEEQKQDYDDGKPETGTYAEELEGRSLPNVLRRISSLIALGSGGGTKYADTELARYWMPDDISRECYECASRFSTLRRRHHCRVCGQIFCSRCCSQRVPGHIFGCAGGLRVCNYCCNVVLSYLKENDMTGEIPPDLRTLQENLQGKFPENKSQQAHKLRDSFMFPREQEERCEPRPQHEALHDVYRHLLYSLPTQQHRYRLVRYNGVWRGCDVLQWVMDNTSNKTRAQATLFCQNLLCAGYMECMTELPQFVDYALYKPAVLPLRTTEDENSRGKRADGSSDAEESTRLESASSSSYCLDLNLDESSARLTKTPKTEKKSSSSEEEPPVLEQNEAPTEARHTCKAIVESGSEHLRLLLRQCLARRALPAAWLHVLYPLCVQAADTIVLGLLLLLVSPCLAQLQLHREPPIPDGVPRSSRMPTEGRVQVRLNHFMAYDTRTFAMKYYYNNEFANVENPNIVIFVGGEWPISPGLVQTGLAYDMAQEMGAGLFYTEHRYYGQTHPLPDSSLENLAFLNIDQALGDLAQFIQHVKSDAFEDGHYRNASVALVGCSYAGTMATWMRMAYPHLVSAAFSDSGPLQAQEEFPEYLEAVATALAEQGGQQCVNAIAAGVQGVMDLLATPAGAAQVSELFKTCAPINAASPLDVATFFSSSIINYFALLVQYATGDRIPDACNNLLSSPEPDAVRRLAALVTGDNCVESRYTEMIARYRNTNLGTPDSTMRLWIHQTCVEYGWYQTTKGSNHPFMSTLPLEFYHQLCKDVFSSDFDEERLRAGIDRTNIFFGGWSHMPDRVVSVAGGHDPWSPMGPNETHAHHNSPVYVIPDISHCRVIVPSPLDSAELVRVRRAVMDHMYEFTTGVAPVTEPPATPEAPGSATGVAASSLMLLLTILALV